ncbi:hypothetical protein [Natronococcus sp. A-GB7]|uniref:hypothetical protein n=1 Tax=Natronococcus sp. A-GB7 TaxID=3037649 RepID=UPI00241ED596|nr:hypothetical protein [Natronococcus sp. A-GB7]MDG5821613.1 hypothetical protein [Natronococcus sp. A-GB7]
MIGTEPGEAGPIYAHQNFVEHVNRAYIDVEPPLVSRPPLHRGHCPFLEEFIRFNRALENFIDSPT